MIGSLVHMDSRRRSLSFENVRTWLLLLTSFVLLGIVYMGQVSQTALIGQRVHDKQDRIERLSQENVQLDADIATLLAPDHVESRARALGLHIAKPDQIKYVVMSDYPVAPTSAAVLETSVSPAKASRWTLDSVWSSLLARMGLGGGARPAEATTP